MDNIVSGKIIGKKVTPGQWGNSIQFTVQTRDGEKRVSCFDNKLTDEAKSILQALVVDMYADFETMANVSKKDGKTYLNIVSATPITQLRDEVVAPVQPSGQTDAPKRGGDSRDRMMLKSYSKDATNVIFQVTCANADPNDSGVDTWLEIYDKVYAHLSAGE
mgnify:CR=1 FL=1